MTAYEGISCSDGMISNLLHLGLIHLALIQADLMLQETGCFVVR